MTRAKWGTKRLCRSCGARFYDLKRKEVVCPKCGAPYQAEIPAKPRRGAPDEAAPAETSAAEAAAADAAPAEAAPAKAAPTAAGERDAPVAGVDGTPEVSDDNAENSESADLVEDVSELGEDADDVAEVVDSSRKGGEA